MVSGKVKGLQSATVESACLYILRFVNIFCVSPTDPPH